MSLERKKLLIAFDGSEHAILAVHYVRAMLPPDQMEIVLFHVKDEFPEVFWDMEKTSEFHSKTSHVAAWALQQDKSMHESLEHARQILLDSKISSDFIHEKVQTRKAGVARDIVSESRHGYDAVVVGRRGLSRLQDLVLGSVANKLVEKLSHVPVWIVGQNPATNKILIPIDGSKGSFRAVVHLGKILEGSDMEVTLAHIIRITSPMLYGFDPVIYPELYENYLGEAKRNISEAFEYARTRLMEAKIDPERIHEKLITKAVSRAAALVQEAEEGSYGTVVLGRRGLSNVKDFFMGRVSNKVIQLSKGSTVWVVN